MQLNDMLNGLSRPKILLKAANIAQRNYSRKRDLTHLIGSQSITEPEQVIEGLLRRESELEEARTIGNAAYNMKLHIHVMAALLQELYLHFKKRSAP